MAQLFHMMWRSQQRASQLTMQVPPHKMPSILGGSLSPHLLTISSIVHADPNIRALVLCVIKRVLQLRGHVHRSERSPRCRAQALMWVVR